MAVGKAGSYSSDLTPSLRTSICHGCSPKKDKTQEKWAKDLNRHFSKKDMEGQQAHEKMLSIPDY